MHYSKDHSLIVFSQHQTFFFLGHSPVASLGHWFLNTENIPQSFTLTLNKPLRFNAVLYAVT